MTDITTSTGAYESARNAVPEDLKERWIRIDQKARNLQQGYEGLQADDDLTAEAKSRRAQELYQRHKDDIEGGRKALRETQIKRAKTAEEFSIPRPSGEALVSQDTNKLLLDAAEGDRIVRTVERRTSTDGPLKVDVSDILREEYRRGLDVGGPAGGSICRGVLRAAHELGVDNEFINPLRSDRHRESLDDARRLLLAADALGGDAPKPPRSLTQAAKRERVEQDLAPRVITRGGPPIPTSAAASHTGRKKRTKKRAS